MRHGPSHCNYSMLTTNSGIEAEDQHRYVTIDVMASLIPALWNENYQTANPSLDVLSYAAIQPADEVITPTEPKVLSVCTNSTQWDP